METPVITAAPLRPRCSSTWIAISGSSPGVTCGSFSSKVTVMPSRARLSHISSPTKPVPITTADLGFFSSRKDLMRNMSLMLRRVNTCPRSRPGIGGVTALAPVARMSLSYSSGKISPEIRFLTKIRFFTGSIESTSCRVLISTLYLLRKNAGSRGVSSSARSTSPPRK
ncbi:hypothetical protein SDC9_159869 [bioreactor metagenome]|uniref:Uncharacterized protein n=1 Tax=bioreactor metagenome TaxID=1076179 RepID=A0A645FDU4_9ZZZZ